MKQTEDEILKEAHDYSAALDRREERREIYMLVLGGYLHTNKPFTPAEAELVAEGIYQGMLKFCGDKT